MCNLSVSRTETKANSVTRRYQPDITGSQTAGADVKVIQLVFKPDECRVGRPIWTETVSFDPKMTQGHSRFLSALNRQVVGVYYRPQTPLYAAGAFVGVFLLPLTPTASIFVLIEQLLTSETDIVVC